MLAVAGHLVQQNFRLPGMLSTSADLSFADMPNGVAAISKLPTLGLFQIILFIGFLELGVMKQKEGSFPGDMTLAGEPAAWTKLPEEVKLQKRVSLAFRMSSWRFDIVLFVPMYCSLSGMRPNDKHHVGYRTELDPVDLCHSLAPRVDSCVGLTV